MPQDGMTREEGLAFDLERASQDTRTTDEIFGGPFIPETPLLSETEDDSPGIPLVSEVGNLPDTTTIPKWAAQILGETAVIRAEETRDLEQSLADLNVVDPHNDLSRASGQRVARERQLIEEAVRTTLPEDTDSARLHLLAGAETLNEEDLALVNHHLSYYRSLDDGTEDPEQIKQRAREAFVADLSVRALENAGLGKKLLDGVEMFVPGNVLYDNYKVSGELFDVRGYLLQVINEVEQLPIDEQILSLATLFRSIEEETGNVFKTVDLVSRLVDPAQSANTKVDTALDLLDVATFGAAALARTAKVVQRASVLRDVRRSADLREQAARANAAAAQDPTVGEVTGIDQVTAMSNATGVRVGPLDPAFAAGLSRDSQAAIARFQAQANQLVSDITGERVARLEGAVQGADREAATQAALADINQGLAALQANVDQVEIVEELADSVVFRLHRGGATQDIEFPLQLDANNQYSRLPDETVVRGFINSPSMVFAGSSFQREVKIAQQIEQSATKVHAELVELSNRAVRDVASTLGLKRGSKPMRRSLARIDEVLLEGDRQGKVFSSQELRTGVNGINLTDQEIEAYYKVRSSTDASWTIRNWAERKAMLIRGLRGVWLDGTTMEVGRPFTEVAGAREGTRNVREMFDFRTQTPVPRTEEDLARIYEEGGRVVRLRSPIERNGGSYRTVIVAGDQIGDLPVQVMKYRAGYVPKVDVQSKYFVKEFEPTTLDGVQIAEGNVTTVRKFRNREEAEAWALRERLDTGRDLRVLEDREIEKQIRAMSFGTSEDLRVDFAGGIFRGNRAEEDIPFGIAGEEAPRLGAFESLSYNMANLSNFVSWNTWRIGLKDRLVKTARGLGMNIGSVEDIDKLTQGTEAVNQLQLMKRTLDMWDKIPTKSEQWFQARAGRIVERWGANLPEGVANALAKMSFINPVAAVKSGTFNLYLGFYNPIQYLIQGSGAGVSLSRHILNPIELTSTVGYTQALHLMDTSQLTRDVAKALPGVDARMLDEMYDLWSRSGLRTSILTTGDHSAAVSGASLTTEQLRKFIRTGRIFYNAGELLNRRTAFTTAFRTWRKANPGARLTRADEQAILVDTNNLLLELGSANRAAWQRGTLGIPTQFMQVFAKTVETVNLVSTNRNFSRVDQLKILATQLALYGSAGIPLGYAMTRWMMNSMGMTQEDIDNADPELLKTLNDGITGWLTLMVTGADLDTGDRTALLANVNQLLSWGLSGGETTLQDLLGAMGGRVNTFWSGVATTLPLLVNDENLDARDVRESFMRAARLVSTFSNIEKAWIMHNYHVIRDSRGGTKIRRDFTTAEEIMRAIGLRLDEDVELDKQGTLLRVQQDVRKKVVDRALELIRIYMERDLDGTLTDDDVRDFVAERDSIFAILPNSDRRLAITSYESRLKKPRTKAERVYQQWLKRKSESLVDGLETISEKLSATGLIKTPIAEEER